MRLLKYATAFVAMLIVALIAIIASDRLAQPSPPDSATLIAKAAHYDVRIRRDGWGVPHILGKTDADVAFGLGFAHSEDDFATIQDVALATRGQLAASEGLKGATTDYLVRLFRVWETVNARYEKDLPRDVRKRRGSLCRRRQLLRGAASGQGADGLLPLTGKDVVAGFVFKTPFFYGLDSMLRKLEHRHRRQAAAGNRLERPRRRAPSIAPTARRACWSIRISPTRDRLSWYEVVLAVGRRLARRRRRLPRLARHAARPQRASGLGEHGQRSRSRRHLPAHDQSGERQSVSARWQVARFRKERCGHPRETLRSADLDLSPRRALCGAGAGVQDRSRRLRHPLCRHERGAPARCSISGSTRRAISTNGKRRCGCRRCPASTTSMPTRRGTLATSTTASSRCAAKASTGRDSSRATAPT